MNFPHANKLNEGLPEEIISSAKNLEDHLNKINWQVFAIAYLYGLGFLLVTLFTIIATIRLAIKLF